MVEQRGDFRASEASEVYLTAAQVRKRYGDCSAMAVHRWLRNKKLGFPAPIKLTGDRNMWKLSDLIRFEQNWNERR
jgi:hypothetical protein